MLSVSPPGSGPAGSDAHVPRLSFSAALTRPMRSAGTIVFNDVFVNENDVYDPKTGEFLDRLEFEQVHAKEQYDGDGCAMFPGCLPAVAEYNQVHLLKYKFEALVRYYSLFFVMPVSTFHREMYFLLH